MSKSSQGMDVGKMALESFGKVMDSMDLVKRSWSGFSVPSAFTPTLDVEELDKRIADLRAVEQWLTLNQNMLRTTIQGLEIQRGTLDAMRAMSDSFGKALEPGDESLAKTLAGFAAAAARKSVTPPAEGTAGAGSAPSPGMPGMPGMPGTAFNWPPFAMPPMFGAAAPAATQGDTTAADAASTAKAAASTAANTAANTAPESAPDDGEPSPAGSASEAARNESAGTAAAPDLDNPQAGPLAWWNMLQENFRQIAQAATANPGASAVDAATPAAGKARKRRPSPSGSAPSGAKSSSAKPSPAKNARAGRTAGAGGKSGTGGKARGGGKPRTPGQS